MNHNFMLFQMLMKKGILVPILSLAAIIAVGGTLVTVADSSKPGDSLYTLDRTSEAAMLSIKKTVSKISYGRYNLTLASERMQEMKDLKNDVSANLPLIKKVSAETTSLQKLNEYIALLLADITKNLTEAQTTLDGLSDAQKEELSLEIADKTTEYGKDLLEISKDLSPDNTKKLTEVITDLEIIDSSAVGFLTDSVDSNSSIDNAQENRLSTTLQHKLETKLLKLRESLRIYVERKETNKATITPENLLKAETLISEITLNLGTAETQLGAQDYKSVGDILDNAADQLDTLKDLVKVEGDEDAQVNPNESEGNTPGTDDNGDDSNDNSSGTGTPRPTRTPETPELSETPEPSETPEASHTPKVTSTPKPSKTPEPSEKPEPSETPEPTEAPEDVHGTQTQPSSNYSLLRNRLRF